MPFGRQRYPDWFAIQPLRHLFPRRRHRERTRGYSRAGGQTQESEQRRPRQTDAMDIDQLPIQPVTRSLMLAGGNVRGVDEEIDVEQYHLKFSPSAWAIASAALSTLTRKAPMSWPVVRNDLRFGRASISRIPR